MSTAVKSKWLFVGTEKGNTHILNLDHFSLSGYIINWNKAIGVHQSAHPGPVSYLLGEHLCKLSSLLLSIVGLHVECLFYSPVSDQTLFANMKPISILEQHLSTCFAPRESSRSFKAFDWV